MMGKFACVSAALSLAVLVSGCCRLGAWRRERQPGESPKPQANKPLSPTSVPPGQWFSMFDGKSLTGWKVVKEADFSMAGKVEVKDGAIILGEGFPFTGITWEGDFPKENFEITWQGKRLQGVDIFGGITVPCGDSHITFVMGGWGDSVVGISNVDEMNASDNLTCKIMSFENNKWYDFRLRVTTEKIEAWINDKQVVDLPRAGHRFSIYPELEPNRPVGFFSWSTTGALRDIQMRRLPKKGS